MKKESTDYLPSACQGCTHPSLLLLLLERMPAGNALSNEELCYYLLRSTQQCPIATEKLNCSIWHTLPRYHILTNNHASASGHKLTVCALRVGGQWRAKHCRFYFFCRGFASFFLVFICIRIHLHFFISSIRNMLVPFGQILLQQFSSIFKSLALSVRNEFRKIYPLF